MDELWRCLVVHLVQHWVRYQLARTTVITRIRRDAALFELPPPRTGRRGRPRTKGNRLPTPSALAAQLNNWTAAQISIRGKMFERLLCSRTVLWYEVAASRPILLVIVRDPSARQPDDFFVSSDISITPATIASEYGDRWAIEDTNRNLKQFLGIQNPQSWVKLGPERIVCLAGWLYSAVWHWYLTTSAQQPTWTHRPWYPSKSIPSFGDALATLRTQTWLAFFHPSSRQPLSSIIPADLISLLANAA
jgi:hypothetical protein